MAFLQYKNAFDETDQASYYFCIKNAYAIQRLQELSKTQLHYFQHQDI